MSKLALFLGEVIGHGIKIAAPTIAHEIIKALRDTAEVSMPNESIQSELDDFMREQGIFHSPRDGSSQPEMDQGGDIGGPGQEWETDP